MVRFTMSLTEEEAKYIEKMRSWYQDEIGVKVTRNAVIKLLLFEVASKQPLVDT